MSALGKDSDFTFAARFIHCQTVHEKKIPDGYVTSLAMSRPLHDEQRMWLRSMTRLRGNDSRAFRRGLKTRGIDIVVLNKTVAVERTQPDDHSVIWQPFGWISDRLLPPRQTGAFVHRPASDQPIRPLLREALGDPVHEDDLIVVFQAP